jgi:hypothetical protein
LKEDFVRRDENQFPPHEISKHFWFDCQFNCIYLPLRGNPFEVEEMGISNRNGNYFNEGQNISSALYSTRLH